MPKHGSPKSTPAPSRPSSSPSPTSSSSSSKSTPTSSRSSSPVSSDDDLSVDDLARAEDERDPGPSPDSDPTDDTSPEDTPPDSDPDDTPPPDSDSEESDNPPPTRPSPRPSHQPRGFLTILSGSPGFGKSSIAAEWPGPIQLILDENDQGILDLVDLGRIDGSKLIMPDEEGFHGCPIIRNDAAGYTAFWKYMELLYLCLEYGKNKYKNEPLKAGMEFKAKLKSDLTIPFIVPGTVLIENLSGLEAAVIATIVRNDLKNNWDHAMNYGGSAWASKAEAKEWPRTIRRINQLRSFGVHVIATCHTEVASDDSEEADAKVRRQKVHKRTINIWQKDANLSGMIALDVKFEGVKEDKRTGAKSGKADRKDVKKKFICTPSPVYLNCKNHFGITDEIILPNGVRRSYEAICAAAKLDPATFRPRGRRAA